MRQVTHHAQAISEEGGLLGGGAGIRDWKLGNDWGRECVRWRVPVIEGKEGRRLESQFGARLGPGLELGVHSSSRELSTGLE